MDARALLDPRCPHHPENRIREEYGVCDFCVMRMRLPAPEPSEETKALQARLAKFARPRSYRTEAEAYDEGIYDDD